MSSNKKSSEKTEKNLFIRITPQFEVIWKELKETLMPASDAELFRTIVKDFYKSKFGEEKLKQVLSMAPKDEDKNG